MEWVVKREFALLNLTSLQHANTANNTLPAGVCHITALAEDVPNEPQGVNFAVYQQYMTV